MSINIKHKIIIINVVIFFDLVVLGNLILYAVRLADISCVQNTTWASCILNVDSVANLGIILAASFGSCLLEKVSSSIKSASNCMLYCSQYFCNKLSDVSNFYESSISSLISYSLVLPFLCLIWI